MPCMWASKLSRQLLRFVGSGLAWCLLQNHVRTGERRLELACLPAGWRRPIRRQRSRPTRCCIVVVPTRPGLHGAVDVSPAERGQDAPAGLKIFSCRCRVVGLGGAPSRETNASHATIAPSTIAFRTLRDAPSRAWMDMPFTTLVQNDARAGPAGPGGLCQVRRRRAWAYRTPISSANSTTQSSSPCMSQTTSR